MKPFRSSLQLTALPNRRVALQAFAGAVAANLLMPGSAQATAKQDTTPPSASQQGPSSEPDESTPETLQLRKRAGLWKATETTWDKPGSKAVVSTGLVAERHMVGPLLQEFLRTAADAPNGKVSRIDYLRFNDTTVQWEYVSLETRADVGIMPAKSFTRPGVGQPIELIHEPFVIPGTGQNMTVLLRMKSVVTYQSPDHDEKEQYFVATDGSGEVWLAHKYVYQRLS